MRVQIEPSLTVYDFSNGVETITVLSWRAMAMVLWANWQLVLILAGALVYGIEQPYGLIVRLWLMACYLLAGLAWLVCDPLNALIVFLALGVSVVLESLVLYELWIDDNGGWA